MSSDAATKKRAQFDVRKTYGKTWKTDLKGACCADCGYCCYALFCPYCASFGLRKRALYNDLTNYICCNGVCPCSGKMNEQQCPACCLCLEVTCCFAQSVAATRWMLQDEMHLQNTPCDNCIIGTMIFLQYLACICQIVACIVGSDELQAAADIIDCIADIVWCTVCACMQTQHHIQLGERSNNPGIVVGQIVPGGVMPPIPQSMPPHQGGHAPQAGYPPPQPGYPAPQAGYPAPAGGHAPPPGYPGAPPAQQGGMYRY